MKEKYKVIDLFCGCGGLSKGFELAGFEISGGVDFNQDAIKTFKKNFKNAKGLCLDLAQISEKKIKEIFGDLSEIDVIIGGPPCQGFSAANRNKVDDDPRNKLFFEFVKFVDMAKPKAIVIENVRGIISENNGYAKEQIYKIFEERGYKVNNKVLDASDYGVPQKRMRNFFVMLRNEVFDFEKMKKVKEKVTVEDAIGELYGLEGNTSKSEYKLENKASSSYREYLRNGNNTIVNHEIKYPAKIVQERISFVEQGENWKKIPLELFANKRNNRHSSAYKRLNEKDVSVTIDTGNSHSNYFHPLYNRIPTVREAARIQSFDDSFVFEGGRTAQYRQVGNAVPPLLSKALAEVIKKELEGNNE